MEKIDVFIRKYATHPQLDTAEALELLPGEWMIDEEENSLFDFLYTIMSTNLHKRRNNKVARQISEMDLLDVEHKLVNRKNAFVVIQPETVCAQCEKKISDKVFAVFPNGIIIHATCGSAVDGKMTVCPVT